MLRFYIAVICPVMEYAAPIWHTCLTAELAESLESVQKHALRIIFGHSSFTNSTYLSFCEPLAFSSLQSRRETLSVDFFHKILQPSCCLHYLIPTRRSNSQFIKTKEPLVILSVIHTYQKIQVIVASTRVVSLRVVLVFFVFCRFDVIMNCLFLISYIRCGSIFYILSLYIQLLCVCNTQ